MGMTKEQLKDRIKEKDVVVLNVLPGSDFEKLHIKGSHSEPFIQDYGAFVQGVEKRYGKGRSFITYCADISSAAAANAAKILRDHGFKAEDYSGGIADWNNAGWPTEGTQAKAEQFFANKK
jgi:rhodanese-related sulfurtransferase